MESLHHLKEKDNTTVGKKKILKLLNTDSTHGTIYIQREGENEQVYVQEGSKYMSTLEQVLIYRAGSFYTLGDPP